jgi:hypothetical protein
MTKADIIQYFGNRGMCLDKKECINLGLIFPHVRGGLYRLKTTKPQFASADRHYKNR